MKSTVISIILGIIIVAAVGLGVWLIIRKFTANADVSGTEKSCDLNKDEKVDALDINAMISAISDKSENPNYDLNKDGKVDNLDLNICLKQAKSGTS